VSAPPLAVSIHALTPLAEDGIVADAAVFDELGCRGACVATDLQGTIPEDELRRQLDALIASGGRCAAARIGWLRGEAQVKTIAGFVRQEIPDAAVVALVPACLDGDGVALAAVRHLLYPLGRVVVVRAGDLPSWTGGSAAEIAELPEAAAAVRAQGARAVLVAGLRAGARIVDLLDDGGHLTMLDAPRVAAPHVPGLAGAHAAAVAGHLARGLPLRDAAVAAQRYVALRLSRGR